MSWQTRYQKASFRGVRFAVEASDLELGRRVAFYDLPGDESKGSAARDMGALPRRHTLTAIVIGTDYDKARDALIAAVERPGPGELVHPYYGKVQVVIDGPVRVRESTADGGVARVEFTFRKFRDQGTPDIDVDTLADVTSAATSALDTLNEDFVGSFTVDGVQEFVRASNLDVIEKLTDEIESINNDIDRILAIPSNIASDIDELSRELADLLHTPQELINTIQATIVSVLNSITRVTNAVGSLIPTAKKAAAMGTSISPVSEVDTPARDRERANQTALIRAVRGSALVSITKVAAGLTYDSSQSALATRDILVHYFNEFAESDEMDSQASIDDSVSPDNLIEGDGPQLETVHERMRELRVAINRHLTQVSGTLPAVVTYTAPETIPAIVIAYQLYQDASIDTQIVERNQDIIAHPSFVPGGRAIEVISNA